MIEVIKRDGTKALFNSTKITEAVNLANNRTDNIDTLLGGKVSFLVEDKLDKGTHHISKIESLVEEFLKSLSRETYKEYSSYRQERVDSRFKGSDTAQTTYDIILGGRNERENGNLDENTFSAKNSKIASAIGEEFSRVEIVSKDILEAFDKGYIAIHDFGSYHLGSHNCTTIDLEDLLKGGFKTKNGGVRQPKSVRSALDLAYLLIGTISQNQFGGCAIQGIDSCLAPYLEMSYNKHLAKAESLIGKCDKSIELAESYTHDELYQAMEGFFHNLSTAHTREGNQLSFSSINYGNDTNEYAVKISKCILETRKKGIGNNREVVTFPIGIFQYSPCLHGEGKELEWLFDLATESTAKNVYPNYVYVSDEESTMEWKAKMSTMGCRTQNGYDRHAKTMDRTGRGNISPVTINLPFIALQAKGNIEKFNEILQDTLKLTEKALLERFEYQASQKGKNAPFLYENGVLKSDKPIGKEDSVRGALKHGSLVFGYVGLAETLVALTGKHHGESKDSYELGLDIITSMREYADEASDRNDLNMSLYATPAESQAMKLRNKTAKEFGVIEGVTNKEYFTNSHHIPVYYPITASEKMKLEVPFDKLATAGNIMYVEMTGDASDNPKAVKSLIREAMGLEIPYFAVNVPIDTCNKCGFKHFDLEVCPKCGGTEIKQLRRITGYTTSEVKNMNDGKQAEVRDRVKHVSFNNLQSLT